jgi:divalent metal cation (Fe/Co/Zn/Cd) transporter
MNIHHILCCADLRTKASIKEIMDLESNISSYHDIKVCSSGADIFIELCIHVEGNRTLAEVHSISDILEKKIQDSLSRSYVHIHQEPEH